MKDTHGKIIIEVYGLRKGFWVLLTGSTDVKRENARIRFYLKRKGEKDLFLCERPFSESVYFYFRNGVSLNELNNCKKWNRSIPLDKVFERMPSYIKRAQHSEAA